MNKKPVPTANNRPTARQKRAKSIGGRGIGTQKKIAGIEGKEGTDYPVADM